MILSCSHICKAFGEKTILSDATFHINDNEKCAIVGINGVGKTTFIKIITGEEKADSGDVLISKGTTVGYLKQQQDLFSENTIYDEIKSAKKDVFALEAKIRRLEQEMKNHTGEALDKMLSEYNSCMTEFERIGGYSCESEITGIIKGLGFDYDAFDQKISTLSGGQKTRVALGRILLSAPDLIILDEPTNHLDMNSIAWLENYLLNYRGAVLIVAHDRYFIDKTVTKIVELDAGKCTMFTGNYSAYSEKKAILRNSMLKAYYNQQQEIKHQEEVITKLRQFNREKSIKRADSREKMLNKIDRIEKPFEIDSEMHVTFKPKISSGNDVLRIEHLSKSFGENHLFSDISFDVKKGEKIAIIGDNGTGKTTILKIINNLETADGGSIITGTNVMTGYYDQAGQVLDDNNTIFDELHNTYPDMTNTEIRNVLASFLFTGDDVFKMIRDISGGERGRVSLAKLMLSDSNLLILDEPTNHLDIVSKELLENAIRNYEGTVLYVSHDRYFINRTATGIIHLTGKHINKYIGNYDYFLEKKEDVERAYVSSNINNNTIKSQTHANLKSNSTESMFSGETSQNSPEASKADWEKQKEQKAAAKRALTRLNKCEDSIHEVELLLAEIDSDLSKPENGYNSALLNELTQKRIEADSKLESLMEEWEKLSEDAESLS